MDKLKQLESFASVALKGSLTAAAGAEGVAPAVVGRRIDALEARLGVKLMVRTTPAYLKRAGAPRHPSELARHECLTLSSDASQTRGWAFAIDGDVIHLRPRGRLDCTDGQVLHDWCLAGIGIAWRSTWEVEHEV